MKKSFFCWALSLALLFTLVLPAGQAQAHEFTRSFSTRTNVTYRIINSSGNRITIPSTGGRLTLRLYIVSSGDTLQDIADRYNTTVAEIQKANSLDSTTLRRGQVLVIPEGTGTPDPAPRPEPEPEPDPESEPVPAPDPEPESDPEPKPSPEPRPDPTPDPEPEPPQSSQLTQDEQLMLDLVNEERTRRGLQPLRIDMEVVRLARMKSQDMVDLGYFSHQSPTYGCPFDMLRAAGISYTRAGENIAGASQTERAHANLMNSPGHRANILNSSYTHVGIGIVDGSRYGKIYTQLFIRKP